MVLGRKSADDVFTARLVNIEPRRPRVHEAAGTVTATSATSLTLKNLRGEEVTFVINDKTRIVPKDAVIKKGRQSGRGRRAGLGREGDRGQGRSHQEEPGAEAALGPATSPESAVRLQRALQGVIPRKALVCHDACIPQDRLPAGGASATVIRRFPETAGLVYLVGFFFRSASLRARRRRLSRATRLVLFTISSVLPFLPSSMSTSNGSDSLGDG